MTVGIVVVSHSARLADAAAELAREMTSPQLRLALAAGVDDPEHPLGTDAARVMAAIEEVDGSDGVLVLMDLGSAVLSAELARDLLASDTRERVLLCPAPLVEGLVAAAVRAAAGGTLEQVAADASDGLAPKLAHLGAPESGDRVETMVPAPAGTRAHLAVSNALGIHARPAARIVAVAGAHDASVLVTNPRTGVGPVSAASLNGLILLGARRGDTLELDASGSGVQAVLAALEALAADDFGDDPDASTPADALREVDPPERTVPSRTLATITGLAASPGLALGPAAPLGFARVAAADLPDGHDEVPDVQRARLESAVEATTKTLAATRSDVAARGGEDPAEILDAHLLVVSDPAILEPAFAAIEAGRDAARAWRDSVDAVVAGYAALEDPVLAERAQDLEAVADEVLAHLLDGQPDAEAPGGVLVGRDLSPTAAARLDPDAVIAVVTAEGSPTAHSAILARALGIPAVLCAGGDVLAIRAGTTLAVDGTAGTVTVDPPASELERLEVALADQQTSRVRARRAAREPATTRDGTVVEVAANVGLAADAQRAATEGADAVGLLRTELLFLDRTSAPDEEEQVEAYRAVCRAVGGRPVTLRLLDVGGDKAVAYLDVPREDNPFLGLRGIRLGLARPQLLAVQIRAALRVAAESPVRLLVPMVTTLAEMEEVRALVATARADLGSRGISVPEVELGAMVEVPAAALAARALADCCDFLSIGTNDLTQYVTAAERGNPAVAHLADPLDPAVLALIAAAGDAGSASSVPVAVCGGLAAEVAAVPLLIGLGIDELSVPPAEVPAIKGAVRAVDLPAARELARRALAASGAVEVRALLEGS